MNNNQAIKDILNNSTYSGKYVSILIPSIKHNENNSGSVYIQKKHFDDLIKIMLKKYGKYSKNAEIIYSINNLNYIITNNHSRKVVETTPLYANIHDKIILSIVSEKTVDDSYFPVINKYNDICKRNIMCFTHSDIDIMLITESYYGDECKYFPMVKFKNDNIDHNKLFDILSNLIDNLF